MEKFCNGVSIVICCHNSADKLPETIDKLYHQQITDIKWEIIVIDNISTDNTYQIAKTLWRKNSAVSYRVVKEKKLGLANARVRGFNESKYDIVSFIDDDNRVCTDWISKVYNLFENQSNVGACGGLNLPAFDTAPPNWFEKFQRSYAIGPQGLEEGDITDQKGVLFGAGLSVRKEAWLNLSNNGFEFNLTGRSGNTLLCGEDYELCFALRLNGWRLWYLPTLTLEHYLPSARLSWEYLRDLLYRVGSTDIILNPYYTCLNNMDVSSWKKILLRNVRYLMKHPVKLLLSKFILFEGDAQILEIERTLGRIKYILINRQIINKIYKKIKFSKWNVQ